MPEMLYIEAVNAALGRALAERDDVLLYGEDVAKPGGVHGVTRGLHKQHGERVFDTPISESAILGSAIGAALVGRRPIVEIMWADFMFVAFDQIINQAANMRYVSRGELRAPITVRTQQGTAPGACAQHSQSVEAFLAHIPGVRVCLPATPQDAYDLTLAAIACDDPTVIIDHRSMYRSVRGHVSTDGPWPAIGGARVHRAGGDVTVVSWGAAVHVALAAAERLSVEHGVSVEVVDPRWLNPLDMDTVLDSVRKTGALVTLHEANVTGGFGAEIVARVVESDVPLRVPPRRLGAADVRIPAAPSLIAAVIPTVESVVEALRHLGQTEAADAPGLAASDDRLRIDAALSRYCYGLDQRAWDEWDGLFTDDAVLDYSGIGLGRLSPAEFRAHVTRNDPERLAGQHLHSNTLVTVDGATAVARAEFTMVNLTRSAEPDRAARVQAGGLVRFSLRRNARGWQIVSREATTKWIERDEIPWAG
jgi:acetoin:2,6-dichlorophenolindophenol oxidoreductase subunit beta